MPELYQMDKLDAIKYPILNELERFVHLFDSSLNASNPLLSEAITHIKQQKGKMMRPILTLLIARLLGKVSEATFHSAVALELLHTASLVHDDVIDESDKRRGLESLNTLYDNKISVLVGDYLLATCLVEASLTCNDKIIKVIAKLGQYLSEGEILQLSNIHSEEITENVYFDVIRKKTAALFSACTTVAALSVNANEEDIEKARIFGEYIGICFQIKDDIFDYFDDKVIGKPTGNDLREGKLTLPLIYALNSTYDKHAENLAVKVKSGTATTEEIHQLITFAKSNGGIEYAKEKMLEFKKCAQNLFSHTGNEEIENSLNCYLDYVVDRVK